MKELKKVAIMVLIVYAVLITADDISCRYLVNANDGYQSWRKDDSVERSIDSIQDELDNIKAQIGEE